MLRRSVSGRGALLAGGLAVVMAALLFALLGNGRRSGQRPGR